MALDVERPSYGQAGSQDAAAASAQQAAPPLSAQIAPTMADAVVSSVQQSEQEQQAVNPAPTPAPRPAPNLAQQPSFTGPTGIMQTPGAMRQPMRSPFERDQNVHLMWKTVANNDGSAFTQLITDSLSGVD